MILRRPYAFLIKHFRLIHIIMFLFMTYITYSASKVLDFYTSYAKNTNMEVIASNYISAFLIFSIIMVIAISLTIYFLMKYKEKPRLLYIIIIAICIVSSILFAYLINNIKTLEIEVYAAKTIRLLRDISTFNYWLLFLSCVPIIIRGLGFDIKRFDFNRDLNELKLEAKDSEEVEVNLDLGSDDVKRKGRKILRELKYYYIENKLFINIILGIVALFLIVTFPFNIFVVNRPIGEKETLSTPDYNFRIIKSYTSTRNSIGKDYSYIILKVQIKGKAKKYALDLNEFSLKGKTKDYLPTQKYYLYFTDLGTGYRKGILNTEDYTDYILMYNIKNTDKKKSYTITNIKTNKKLKIKPEEIN